jgi:hypothetical protein
MYATKLELERFDVLLEIQIWQYVLDFLMGLLDPQSGTLQT